MDYEKIMSKARKTNDKRDKSDQRAGFATPNQGRLSIRIKTAMSAIQAGIKIDDWDCVAEGQAMLEKIEIDIRKLEERATND